jgi:hypothetical protein
MYHSNWHVARHLASAVVDVNVRKVRHNADRTGSREMWPQLDASEDLVSSCSASKFSSPSSPSPRQGRQLRQYSAYTGSGIEPFGQHDRRTRGARRPMPPVTARLSAYSQPMRTLPKRQLGSQFQNYHTNVPVILKVRTTCNR